MNLAIAGCGRISQLGYAAALRGLPGIELGAVADPDRGRREELARRAGAARSFDSVATMLAEARPDAIVIASPPEHHYEHAALAAGFGVPALVEKPPGRDAAEAARLAALDGPVSVGFNRRFSHLAAIAGKVPGEGELDLSLQMRYRRASWRAHEVHDDALSDLAPHLADLAACLLGGELTAARAISIDSDQAVIVLTGPRGEARIECKTNALWRELVEVRRRSGALSARSVQGGPARGALARLGRGDHPLVASLAGQLRAFAASVRGGGNGRLATAADGVLAMRALDAARRSAASHGATVAL